MAIDIPVPKIVPDAPLGGYGLGVYNALTDKSMEQAINKAKAQYAPFTEYANAASHMAYANLLPYQIQATVLSNPLVQQALKNNPEAVRNMFSNFNQSVPTGKNIFGGVNLPRPDSGGGGFGSTLLGMLINKLTGGQSPQQEQMQNQLPTMAPNMFSQQAMGQGDTSINQTQPIQQQQAKGALVAPRDSSQQVITKGTTPYQQLDVKGGIPYLTNEGDVVVPPSSGVSETVQKQLIAINNAKESVKKLANGAKEFLTPGGYRDLKKSQASNWFEQNVFGIPTRIKNIVGVDKDKVSRYAQFLSEQGQAVENIMNAYNLPGNQEALKMVQHIVEPLPGEDEKGYEKRMLDELQKLKERYKKGEDILTGGFKVDENSEIIKIPQFKNAKQFREWYQGKSDTEKLQIRRQLGDRQ